MSIDLVTANNIGGSPQAIQDQSGNSSALYISSGAVNLPDQARLVFGINGSGTGEWIQNNAPNGTYGIAFIANSQQYLTLLNTGNFGVGTTTPTADFHVSGSVRFQGLAAGNGTDLVIDSNGNVFTQSCSARFKENIRELKADFKRILDLQPMSFSYKDNGGESVGYMAEEVAEKGLKDLVGLDAEGKPASVHYKALSVYLVELVKQQQALLETLQTQVSELGSRFGGLAPQPAAV